MANITAVHLLSVPIEKDYAHTIYFASATDQYNYFIGKAKKSYPNCSYQRKDNIFRAPDQIDALYSAGVNYVMYQNAAYGNRWFYAFITDMKYIDDQRTDITIKTDCIQTWMFDITIKPSFVEREHAASDEVGENTIPEGLELGEYTANKHTLAEYGGSIIDGAVVVLGVTKLPDGTNAAGTYYDGIYSGIKYYAFTNHDIINNELDNFLAQYDADGIGEAVSCMFMAPKDLIIYDADDHYVKGSNIVSTKRINYSGDSEILAGTSTALSLTTNQLDGYSPKNNKLLTFPFRYLLTSNNSGGSVIYKYERFFTKANNVKTLIPAEFIVEGCLTPGCSIRMVPCNYNGVERNDDEGINMGKFPILNWTSDVYTNWLTQNGVNIALDIASGIGQIAAGIAMTAGTGGVGAAVGGGSIVGGVSQIAGTLGQIHQQSFTPPQVKGNINAGDAVTASEQNDFHFYDMTIKAEYARIIDEYFNMFGYKCNRVKIPAKAHRANWWYTKTIDANITGSIPQQDMQQIKECYNRGITFWRNNTNFRNYAADNSIV